MHSRFDFFRLGTCHLVFWLGQGLFFTNSLKLFFFRQSESTYFFVTIKSVFFYNCYKSFLRMFNFSQVSIYLLTNKLIN